MTTISLTQITANMESDAVAAGKLVLAALTDASTVTIEDNDLAEDVWEEMVQYLGRRGVTIRYDHDDAFPVAETAVARSARLVAERGYA